MGIPASDIDVQRLDNSTDLSATWDMWAGYSFIEGLDLYSHGYSGGAEVAGGSGDFWESAKKLNWGESLRSINGAGVILQPYASFHGCNTANGDFAQNFANTQGVTTYGSTDYTSFSKNRNSFSGIKDYAKSRLVYLAVYNEVYVFGVRLAKTSRVPMKEFKPK